jgi:hypothetical protein
VTGEQIFCQSARLDLQPCLRSSLQVKSQYPSRQAGRECKTRSPAGTCTSEQGSVRYPTVSTYAAFKYSIILIVRLGAK